ncbi:hypothetical protein J3D45_001025 [Microbacterium foliorum]|uniref:hypothetical protein n=1 Tax=Microbacterium foliorum TaxID=104336 RepID=UPI00209FA2EA|nr:hypothetical protein [Microbacterium foliorum]MCP1428527.1 hypothetical protein [Microbacterium foliorum]
MAFRKPKTPISQKLPAAIGGVLAVLAVIIVVNMALSSGGADARSCSDDLAKLNAP